MTEVSLLRLYLLRAMYLLIAVGQGLIQWPLILHHTHPWVLMSGVGHSMLAALSLVCLIGLRYPLQMLPVMIFEISWKLIWLIAVAVPLALANQIDADTLDSVKACLGVAIVIAVVPWRYVLENYAKKPGDRWWGAEKKTAEI